MIISLKEAWKIAKDSLGKNLRKVEVSMDEDEEIYWNIMDVDFHSERSPIFFKALQLLKVVIDNRDKKPVTDVEVEQENETKTEEEDLDETKPVLKEEKKEEGF